MSPRVGALLLVLCAAAAAFGLYLQALFVAASVIWMACLGRSASVMLVFTVAVALRVPFAFANFVSNDMHRYVWEGRLQLEGHNPYVMAPSHERLAYLRGPRHADINNRDYTSIYPPLAQSLFVGAVFAGLEERGLRVVILVLDIILVALLLAWFRDTGRPPGMTILYAWAPLAVISPGMGHVDPLMLLGLAAAAWAWECERPYRAAILLACAALAKFAAVMLVPWLLLRHWRAVVFAFVPTVAVAYVPYAAPEVFDTLYAFGADFAFNGSLYRIAEWITPEHARLVVLLVLAAWTAFVVLTQPRFAVAGTLLLAGLLVCSPTVHHWYLTWFLVLLAAVGPKRWAWPLLAWCVTVVFSSQTYKAHHWEGETWTERLPFTFVEYAVPALVAMWLLWRGRPRRVAPAAPRPGAPTPGRYAVVIPCRGEAASLAALLPRWHATDAQAIVLADTPTGDGTEALAAEWPRVVYCPVERRGYGAAVQAGFAAAGDVDFWVVADADHGRGPDQVAALLAPLADPRVGLVCGARTGGADQTLPQRFGNRLATTLIGLGWGRRFEDLGPFRALRRSAWPAGALTDPGFGWNVEMNVRALELGMEVVEVALPASEREHGANTISGTVRGVLGAGYGILERLYRLRERAWNPPSSS